MKIMGVDPGTIKAGWGLLDYEGGEFREPSLCGVIGVPQRWRMSMRLVKIYGELHGLVLRHQPDVVVVETPFVGRNARTALAMGQALAAVMMAAEMSGVRLAYYSPTEVKRAVTSYGFAVKDDVARSVVSILGIEPVGTHDATDALAVAICFANHRDEAAILQREDRP